MRKLTILTLSLFLTANSFGQKLARPIQTENKYSVVVADSTQIEWKFNCHVIETEARFGTGPGDWDSYLQKNLKREAPINNGCPPGRYRVSINFMVSKEGNVSMIKAATNYGYGMEAEAIRIIGTSPKWIAATRNGRKVITFLCQDIIFDVCESANIYVRTTKRATSFITAS